MRKILLLLFLALQCLVANADGKLQFNNALRSNQVKKSSYIMPAQSTNASDNEDTWVSIGTGEWTDGAIHFTDGSGYLKESVTIEKSETRPNVFRVLPFKQRNIYLDYVVIHCESSKRVYFESFSTSLNVNRTYCQAVEENGVTRFGRSYYGTINNGVITIPLTCFNFQDEGDSDSYYFKEATSEYILKMPVGFQYIESASGVYMGLTSFNDYVKTNPISLLNENTCEEFTSFVNNMEMGTFTNLYKAVDVSIDNLKSHPYPDDLSNVILITFTDGLDMGSLDESPFLKNKEYADYLAKKIAKTKIRGITLKAYSIGLMSRDVYDEEEFMYNLNSIASQKNSVEESESDVDYVCTVNDTRGLENQLTKIYENVNRQITRREITIAVPMMEHECVVRFTLDGVSHNGKKAKDSKVWFEGIFNRLDMTLENIKYTGFTSTSGQTFKIEKSKIKDRGYDVVLHDCRDIDGSLLEVGHGNIDQYIYIPSRDDYRHNIENAKDDDIKIEDIKSSVGIMLVLDASKSLEESDQGDLFPLVKSSACSFIDLLAGKSNISGIDDIILMDTQDFDFNDPDVEFYNLQGIRITNPSSGIYICRKDNIVKKIVIR